MGHIQFLGTKLAAAFFSLSKALSIPQALSVTQNNTTFAQEMNYFPKEISNH